MAELSQKSEIVRAAAGSLLTAQLLCWHIAIMAEVEARLPERRLLPNLLAPAIEHAADALSMKFRDTITSFSALGQIRDVTAVDLLVELARSEDGMVRLDEASLRQPHLASGIEALIHGQKGSFVQPFSDHLLLDTRSRLLVVEDPQLIFYLRQMTREQLAAVLARGSQFTATGFHIIRT